MSCAPKPLSLLVWLCLLWIASCATDAVEPRIVLQIDSNLQVPAELDRLTVEVVGQTEAGPAEADLRIQGLPRTVTLSHTSGPLGPVQVTVRGWLGGTVQVSKQLALYFRSDTQVRVSITLTRDCLGVMCPASQTCELGSCVPVVTPLPELDGGGPADGGQMSGVDAGGDAVGGPADAAPRDAGPIDPTRDAGVKDAGVVPPVPDAGPRDAGPVDTGVPMPGAGARPVCTIERPVQNDLVQTGTPLMLRGSCTDPETGPIKTGMSWVSQVEGALGSGGAITVMLHNTGRQRLTLCASDPRDAMVMGCVNVEVIATDVAQPTALITSISQGGSEAPPFVVGQPIQLRGVGTGAGVTLSWSDSLQGDLGTGNTATILVPVAGQHRVTLTVRDRDGKTATRTVDFMVRPRTPMMMGP